MKKSVYRWCAVAFFACSTSLLVMGSDVASAASDPFTNFDRNENGVIDPDEFPGGKDRFAQLDVNGDGVLSREELRSTNPSLKPDSGDRKGGPPSGGQGPGKGNGPGGFKKDDANGDGKVTKEEFSGPADLFEKLDTNGDGVLTEDEAGKPPEGGGGPGGKGGPPQF